MPNKVPNVAVLKVVGNRVKWSGTQQLGLVVFEPLLLRNACTDLSVLGSNES
jgi:hypothetical protein